MSIEQSIEYAAKELPKGWQVVVVVENGSGTVELLDDDGEKTEFPTVSESLSESIQDAVEQALIIDEVRRTYG